ncbi:MAG: ABC transporter ATP-binding protein [Ruminococcus sp.]|nr:ABC transporter ATP-binding protein [Ruminococcus sp.]
MIEFKELTKKFSNEFTALDKINLTIEKGTAFGLLGSNGAGKSTMLRLIAGIYRQEAGELLIDGEKVYDNVKIKEKIFFINDETIQFGHHTLKSLKDFYKGFYPNFSEELFDSLREKIGLPFDKKLNQFSKGMKRQAIVIVGLACQTDYLMLDEAFDGLDPAMRIIVKRMLVDAMIDRELTVIISSHNLKEISEICDTVAFVHHGQILFAKSIDSVKNEIHKIQVAYKEAPEENAFEGLDIVKAETTQSVRHYIVRGDHDQIKKVFEATNPIIFELIPLTLEEIFIIEMEGKGYGYENI